MVFQVVSNKSEDALSEAFKVFDKDEDGYLTVNKDMAGVIVPHK